jgi:hypothetical protein
MAQKIIPTGQFTTTITASRVRGDNTEISLEISGIPAITPILGAPDIANHVQVDLDTNIFNPGFSDVTFTDTGNNTVKMVMTASYVSKKPNTSSALVPEP